MSAYNVPALKWARCETSLPWTLAQRAARPQPPGPFAECGPQRPPISTYRTSPCATSLRKRFSDVSSCPTIVPSISTGRASRSINGAALAAVADASS